MKNFYEVSRYKLIYVFGIADNAHRGLLKIGDATISTDKKNLPPNCKELKTAACKRIDDYTQNAGIAYKLLHAELAVTDDNKTFRDYDIHRLLKRYKTKIKGTKGKEWFRVDLDTVKRAIAAFKQDKIFSESRNAEDIPEEIIFRPEQETAVNKTVKYFQRGGKDFLWNAKMRFGKTLCALEVVSRMNFTKTIIVTHRPVVKDGWFKDFDKIFHDDKNYLKGSQDKHLSIKDLLASQKNFVYFASIQDLRGSEKFNKNAEIFGETWDFVIVDEAHEGTQTTIGQKVLEALAGDKTKFLYLSGTPFNLREGFPDESVYTWDYLMEQRAKADWDVEHFGDSNPYADLPRMNVFTYNLGEIFPAYFDTEEMSFNFREFFRTNDAGNFVHEADVKSFLDLLVTENDSNYPFSNEKFRDMFRHTLWIVPGVKAGQALSQILHGHRVFGNDNFGIANVAGDGDEDIPYKNALDLVKDTIAENDYSITISCGKLTTGVTVPQWTAVLYLSGNYLTSAAAYLQTIFRVQTPCNENGVSKQNCYVFDFAPDRALRMVAASAAVANHEGNADDTKILNDMLKFCPVIAVEGSGMNQINETNLFEQIYRVHIEHIAENGFDHPKLYNKNFWDLSSDDLKKYGGLNIVSSKSSKRKKSDDDIIVNAQGLANERREVISGGGRRTVSPEEKALRELKRERRNLQLNIRAISVRVPLLVYGADISSGKKFTLKMFFDSKIIDDESWKEFMPKGLTRKKFRELVDRFYDIPKFIGSANYVRQRAKAADELTPTERVKAIAELFATFKNPDKETVLTPWRVVNLHMTEVFGGWNFFADNPPQFVPTEIFRADKKILEINSKTGLYPLFVAYSIYRDRLGNANEAEKNLADLQKIWDATVAENVFVICKTPMAKTITRRTLLGYRGGTVNAHCFDDLINTLKNKPKQFVKRVKQENFWNKGSGTMFFDAVVGNPPYQISGSGDNKTFSASVYNLFMENSFKLADKVSLITPARFLFNAGATPQDFRNRMLSDPHLKVVRYEADGTKLFPTSEIKGGVAITLHDTTKNFGAIGTFFAFDELKSIHQKVCVADKNFLSLSEIMYSRTIYNLTPKLHEDFPDAKKSLSKGHLYDMSTNIFNLLPQIFFDAKPNDGHEYIQIFGMTKSQRVYKYIRRDYVNAPAPLNKWKVLLPDANGSGAIGEVLSTPLVGSPLVGCTETFITVGAFDTEAEADACLKYIKTKFARAMLGILKVTQHNPPSTWAKVPLQDFTASSDIDWTQPVAQIDEQLYRKYGLTDAEKNFIKSHVKAMS